MGSPCNYIFALEVHLIDCDYAGLEHETAKEKLAA
jgi:hypothetical protein